MQTKLFFFNYSFQIKNFNSKLFQGLILPLITLQQQYNNNYLMMIFFLAECPVPVEVSILGLFVLLFTAHELCYSKEG